MQKPSRNPLKFEQDFDFEQANTKFEELRSQLSKLKVGDEPKSEQVSFLSFHFYYLIGLRFLFVKLCFKLYLCCQFV